MKLVFSSVLVAVFFALPYSAIAGPFQDGQAAYQRHDYATALRDLRKSAEQGSAPAELRLGSIYSQGLGVPQDYVNAVKWYLEAADQGNGAAQLKLGTMAARGRRMPKDNICALMWYNLAAARGVEYASGKRDALERTILPFEIAQAQSLSQDWRPAQPGSQAIAPREKVCPPIPRNRSGFVVLD
jgi:TPR repeat protein